MFESIILAHAHSSIILFFIIIIGSYVFEDGAIIGAAFTAINGYLSYSSALIAITLGIMSGDIGLYYLGRAAHRWAYLEKKLERSKFLNSAQKHLQQNTVVNLFIIRFIPGLRTVCYSLSGYYNLSLRTFTLTIFAATVVWTSLIFTIIYKLGTSAWLGSSHQKIIIFSVCTAFLLGFNYFMQKRLEHRQI